ncbi:lysylphosphatidylglycerol synthase domain-containing protein [Nocardioides sp. NPDC101246]|uniref:lysylphosphatidylglycerol synthase domain-containing protein n=1 Tax=Nocardioides sp. NPDC101246 TaxID=3364336 RepID=UPI003820AA5B
MSTPEGPDVSDARPGRRAWITRIVLLVVAALSTVIVVRLVGRVDWEAARDALRHLSWWHYIVLLAVVLVRQILLAMPLSFFIRGVTFYRATINDLGATLMYLIGPPPSDIALRVAMFKSWGVSPAKGLAGTVMNSLTFYVARFSGPLVGFMLLLGLGEDPSLRWVELLSIAIAVGVLVTVLLIVRSDPLARAVGTSAGLIVRRFRRSVDPDRWADACQSFRADISERFHSGFPLAVLSQVGMMVVDLAALVLCLRFVGVTADEVSLVWIAIAYLFAFPFTVFPLWGIGIVDALILAALVEAGGPQVEGAAVAALIVWRVFTVGAPVLLGAVAIAAWRREVAVTDSSAPERS